MKMLLLRLWWAVTAPWRCGCCGELKGKRCDRYCRDDGCPDGCAILR